MRIFGVYDKVAGSYRAVFAANSAGQAVRDNLLNFLRFLPREDIDLVEFDDDFEAILKICSHHVVDIEKAYRFPDAVLKNLATGNPDIDQRDFNQSVADVHENQQASEARSMEV